MSPNNISFSRILIALVIYGTAVGVLLWLKPVSMFDDSYNARTFGTGQVDGNQTIFAPSIVFPALAIIAYFIASWIELVTFVNPRVLKLSV